MMGLEVVGVDHLFVGLATDSRVPAFVVSESTSGTIFAHKNIAEYVSTILSTLKCSLDLYSHRDFHSLTIMLTLS